MAIKFRLEVLNKIPLDAILFNTNSYPALPKVLPIMALLEKVLMTKEACAPRSTHMVSERARHKTHVYRLSATRFESLPTLNFFSKHANLPCDNNNRKNNKQYRLYRKLNGGQATDIIVKTYIGRGEIKNEEEMEES